MNWAQIMQLLQQPQASQSAGQQPGWNFEQPWSLPQSTDQNMAWSQAQNKATGDQRMLSRGNQFVAPNVQNRLQGPAGSQFYDPNEIYGLLRSLSAPQGQT